MKVNNKISNKTLAIFILIILIVLMIFIPFEKIIGRPSILGAVTAKVFVRPLESNNTCSISLIKGWNLISIACIPDDTSITSVLNPINGEYTSIHTYNATDTIDHWKSYNPDMPSWVIQDLNEISNKNGYWIKMDNDSSLNILGTISLSYKITLIKGWNLIGYPSNSSTTPPNAFSTIIGSYTIVWAYNTSSDSYLYHNPDLGTGTLTEISPNKGYWINMTQNNTLWLT